MDALGDHAADLCPSGFGRIHRYSSMRDAIAIHVASAAGRYCVLEAPFLVPGTESRSADFLIDPPGPSKSPDARPTVCDITVVSSLKGAVRAKAM